jgi:hypothetical protein
MTIGHLGSLPLPKQTRFNWATLCPLLGLIILNILSQHMFHSLAHKYPNQYLAMFEELCNTVKINGIEHGAIKLRVFPFFLGEMTRSWLRSLDAGTSAL